MDRREILSSIEFCTDEFIRTGFFPYAMKVFCLAHANGLPIPKVTLDAIEKGFR